MSRATIVGILANTDDPSRDGRGKYWATRADDFADTQDARIPIDTHHDGITIGEVIHLERDAWGRLWCVGQADTTAIDAASVIRVRSSHELATRRFDRFAIHVEPVNLTAKLYWSSDALFDDSNDTLLLRSVALTTRPARVLATPVEVYPGGLHLDAARQWGMRSSSARDAVQHAAVVKRSRPAGEPIRIAAPTHPVDRLRGHTQRADTADDGLWHGQPGRILSVR
jgi:hypothetical protein